MTWHAVRFSLIAGVVMSAFLVVSLIVGDRLGAGAAVATACAGLLAGFAMIGRGVRSYRDRALGGRIGFGRAFRAGLLMACIACGFAVTAWEYLYFGGKASDFEVYHSVAVLKNARASGATTDELAAKRAALDQFQRLYSNPATNVGINLMAAVPLALLSALASAGWVSGKWGAFTTEKDRMES